MASGTSLHEDIAAVGVDYMQRDPALYDLATAGKTPDYIKDPSAWIPVTIGGRLTVNVCPDYWGYGNKDDVFRDTGSPYLAQRLADLYNAILPTTKLLAAIQAASAYKWPYQDIKGKPYYVPLNQIETEDARVKGNNMANKLFADAGATPGDALAIGYRKAIVVGPSLDGSKVAIAGSSWDGQGTSFVQPYSTIHTSNYVDYSHGIVLISRDAILDGALVDLATLVENGDPLVTDQGGFRPFFPNVGGEAHYAGESGGGGLEDYAVDRSGGGGGGDLPAPVPGTVMEPGYVAPGDPFGDSATRTHPLGGSGEMKTDWLSWAFGAVLIGLAGWAGWKYFGRRHA